MCGFMVYLPEQSIRGIKIYELYKLFKIIHMREREKYT